MEWRQRIRDATPYIGLALALVVGAALRWSFHGVIEWKSDEKWSYDQAQAMLASGAWPPIGMPSSVGAPNPGLSLWVFAVLMEVFQVRSPPDLAFAVQTLNIAALLAFTAFAFRVIRPDRREPWLWAAALWALNPISVILERKIWPPSVLPLPMVGFIAAWWFRKHPLAAFAWGALGALMAQIHMGASFLAFAVAAWTWHRDRAEFPWIGWLAGSLVGALPAIPWVLTMLAHGSGGHAHLAPPAPNFYMRWPTEMFGYDVKYTLGGKVVWNFLAWPAIGHAATHLMGFVYAALAGLAIVAYARALRPLTAPRRLTWSQVFLGDSRETTLICAALWGYGGILTLITLAGAGSSRHYMIVVTPLMALWTAMTVLWSDRGWMRPRGRQILTAACALQAVFSFCLLAFIAQQGVIKGEFGPSWQAQQRSPAPDLPPR